MLVELIHIKETPSGHRLSKIWVNPKHIVYISENLIMKSALKEGTDLGLVSETTFSTVKLNESGLQTELCVVGDPESIESKIFSKKRQSILRG